MINKKNFLKNKKIQKLILDDIFIYDKTIVRGDEDSVFIKTMRDEGFINKNASNVTSSLYKRNLDYVNLSITELISGKYYYSSFYLTRGIIEEMQDNL